MMVIVGNALIYGALYLIFDSEVGVLSKIHRHMKGVLLTYLLAY